MGRTAERAILGLALASCIGIARQAGAHGAEGASHHLILPLVIAGRERESQVSIMNVKGVPTSVVVRYVGAVGTPFDAQTVGITDCDTVQLGPEHSLTLLLSRLCPRLATPDAENLGYLELLGSADTGAAIAAAQLTRTRSGTTFRVEAEPLGAFDRSASLTEGAPRFRTDQPLEVRGLIDERFSALVAETTRPLCFLAAHDEPKAVTVGLLRAGAAVPDASFSITLRDREMRVFDVVERAGLQAGSLGSAFRVVFDAANSGSGVDGALLIAGCGSEFTVDRAMDYRLARTAEPSDESRRRYVRTGTVPTGSVTVPFVPIAGPYGLPSLLGRTEKMVLQTDLQAEDRVQCAIDPEPAGGSGPFRRAYRDWLALRIVDPRGNVVAGGPGIKDVTFLTGRRAEGADGRWRIEISPDESSGGLPPIWGPWAVLCESASGMSLPLPVPFGSPNAYAGFPDDF
jgi:hypothetical protein